MDLSALLVPLSDDLALPDEQAASKLDFRMHLWTTVDDLAEGSYIERGIIASEIQKRELWKYLGFRNFNHWAYSKNLGSHGSIMEAKSDVLALGRDIEPPDLAGIPKRSIKVLRQLSSAIRRDKEILQAARDLPSEEFVAKIGLEHPDQHIEQGLPGVEKVKEAVQYALDHDIAGTTDEARLYMATAALEWWAMTEVSETAVEEFTNESE